MSVAYAVFHDSEGLLLSTLNISVDKHLEETSFDDRGDQTTVVSSNSLLTIINYD